MDNGRPSGGHEPDADRQNGRSAPVSQPFNMTQQRNPGISSESSSPISDPTQDHPPQSHRPMQPAKSEPRSIPIQREQPTFEQQLQMKIQSRNLGMQQRQAAQAAPAAREAQESYMDEQNDRRPSVTMNVIRPGPAQGHQSQMQQPRAFGYTSGMQGHGDQQQRQAMNGARRPVEHGVYGKYVCLAYVSICQ